MNIEVLNLSKDRNAVKQPGVIYIGRGIPGLKKSALANPFKMGGEDTRNQVCEQYLSDVLNPAMDSQSGPVWDELSRLADRVNRGESIKLACWCSPKRCHGFDVAAAIKSIADRAEPVKPSTVAAWKEIGTPRFKPCDHPGQIPGLDAVGCQICREWFVDQSMRDLLVPPRKGSK